MPEETKVRHISAGPGALAAAARLLGLKIAGPAWRLEGLCGLGRDNVRVSLRHAAHRLVFYLLPRSSPGAAMHAAKISLAVEGEAGRTVLEVLKIVAARLGDRSLDDFLGMMDADPRSFVEQVVPGRSGDRIRVPCIGQPIGILEAGWRNFFADQDFEVLLGVPECLPHGTVTIEYTDLECYYARPKLSFRKWSFLDWPEEEVEGMASLKRADAHIVTELEERDMILGAGERADALVEEARRIAASGKFLVFTHLCTPIVMGEDFQGLARRCRAELGGQTVSWSQKDRDENDNFGEYFRSLMSRPGYFDAHSSPETINLFYFPKGCREEELRPFLEGIGLKINVCIFPDVDFPSIENLPRAVWQIFCERSSYPTKIQEILAQYPRPVARVGAPYGLEGTRECLRSIAAATGKTKQFEAAWRKKLDALLPSWEKMNKEAARWRLAFVVSEATLPRLLELRHGHGAPLATMVKEMGFGIDLLYYDIHGESPKLPEKLRGARVTVFRAPWELEQVLAKGNFQAVYSDVFFDWRISRAGKARFSSRDFEMGLAGAQRTFQRLLAICRLPFYRRYAKYLAGVSRKSHV